MLGLLVQDQGYPLIDRALGTLALGDAWGWMKDVESNESISQLCWLDEHTCVTVID